MAEPRIELLRLDFDFKQATVDIADLKDRIEQLKQTNKELKTSAGGITPEYEKNASTIRKLSKEYRVQAKVLDDYNDSQKKSIPIIQDTDGSIKSLEAALARNRNAYRQLSKEQRETDVEAKKLLETIKAQDKEYKELQTEIGTTAVNVGDYRGALRDVIKEQQALGGILGGALGPLKSYQAQLIAIRNASVGTSAAMQGASKSARAFGAALVATGIGAILVAFGSLIALLTKTQRGLDFLAVAGDAVGSVFANITDLAIKLGDGIVRAVTNPRKALQSFADLLKGIFITPIVESINIVGALGRALGNLVRGDFKGAREAAESAGDSFKKIFDDSIVGQAVKVGKAVADVGKEIGEEAKIAAQLRRELIALEKAESDLNVTRSETDLQIAELNKRAKDQRLSADEQRKAAEQAIALEKALIAQEVAIQQRRVDIYKQQNELSESTEADLQRVRDAEIALNNAKRKSVEVEGKLQSQLVRLDKQRVASALKAGGDIAESLQEIGLAQAKNVQDLTDRYNAGLQAIGAFGKEREQLTEAQLKALEKLEAEHAKQITKLRGDQDKAIQAIIDRGLTEEQAAEASYQAQREQLLAFGEERLAATEGGLRALELLEAEHQKKLADIRAANREKELTDRLGANAEAFARTNNQLAQQLNEQLALVVGNEEETARVRAEFRQRQLEEQRAFFDQQFQEIQAALSVELTADSDAQSVADTILSDEEKQLLQDRLAEVQLALSEIDLQLAEMKYDEEGEVRTLGKLLGLDEAGVEKLQEGFAAGISAVSGFINSVGDIGAARTAKQLKELDKQRKSDTISQAQYDKKKEQIERQAFQRQKAIQAATATVSYLQGIVNILSSPSTIPDPFGRFFKIAQIAFLSASYGAQLSKIKSQQYEEGGLVEGPSHAEGGVPFRVRRSQVPREMEGGEFIVRKSRVTPRTLPLLRYLNGDRATAPRVTRIYQDGGLVPIPGAGNVPIGGGIDTEDLARRTGETVAAAVENITIVTDVKDVIDETERRNEITDLGNI